LTHRYSWLHNVAINPDKTKINFYLRGESLALLALVGFGYHWLGYSWWLFAVGFLLPDLGMLGYLVNPKVGASTYNFCHVAIFPIVVGLVGYSTSSSLLMLIALVRLAHISFDRALGYGLKYDTNFVDTHLGELGRTRS
jgi:hypothetical protein